MRMKFSRAHYKYASIIIRQGRNYRESILSKTPLLATAWRKNER